MLGDEHDLFGPDPSQAAPDGAVVSEVPVAVELHEVLDDPLDVVSAQRAVGVAGDLYRLPGAQAAVGGLEHGHVLRPQLADVGGKIPPPLGRLQIGDLPRQRRNGFFEGQLIAALESVLTFFGHAFLRDFSEPNAQSPPMRIEPTKDAAGASFGTYLVLQPTNSSRQFKEKEDEETANGDKRTETSE